jgi:hypothetical protein
MLDILWQASIGGDKTAKDLYSYLAKERLKAMF